MRAAFRRVCPRTAVPVVIETAALLAILLGEPERGNFLQLLSESETRLLSAANAMETAIIVESRRGEVAGRELDLFLHRTKIEIVAVDEEQFSIARFALRKFGKGRHAAGVDFGDRFGEAPRRADSWALPATRAGRRRTAE